MKKIAIIGGGPAGIFCAYKIIENLKDKKTYPQITIFEKNKPLSTLLATANGRCNLAYNEYNYKELAQNYPRGEKFLYSIFSRYGLQETLEDFEKLGIETYVQDDNRIFPKSNKASSIKFALLDKIKNRVKFETKEITEPLLGYDAVIIATGLNFGADLAQKYGHKIIPLKSSLTGLKIAESEFFELKGVSFNNLLFTDIGITGPYIYKLSSNNAYKEFPYKISIPIINKEELIQAINENPKKMFKNVVSDFIPKSVANLLVKTDVQCANVSKKEIDEIVTLNLTITGTDGRGEIVHAGGVDLDEIDKNLKSKIVENLWIIGEVLNIDGYTGGFNLQNCWSTASIAASDIVEKLYP